jgi:hypothetical protein
MKSLLTRASLVAWLLWVIIFIRRVSNMVFTVTQATKHVKVDQGVWAIRQLMPIPMLSGSKIAQ